MQHISFIVGVLIAAVRTNTRQWTLAPLHCAGDDDSVYAGLRTAQTLALGLRKAVGLSALAFGLYISGWPPYDAGRSVWWRWGTDGTFWASLYGGSEVYNWWTALGAWIVLAALAWGDMPLVRRALAARPLQWLARQSFALYLYHGPILCSLGAALVRRLLDAGLSLDAAVALMAVPFTLVTLIVSALATRYIDGAALAISARLESLIFVG